MISTTNHRCVCEFRTRYKKKLDKKSPLSVERLQKLHPAYLFISQNKNLLHYLEHAPRDDAFSLSINSQGPRKCRTFRSFHHQLYPDEYATSKYF